MHAALTVFSEKRYISYDCSIILFIDFSKQVDILLHNEAIFTLPADILS